MNPASPPTSAAAHAAHMASQATQGHGAGGRAAGAESPGPLRAAHGPCPRRRRPRRGNRKGCAVAAAGWKEAQEVAAGAELIWGRSRTPGLMPCSGWTGDGGSGSTGLDHLAGSPAHLTPSHDCHNGVTEGGATGQQQDLTEPGCTPHPPRREQGTQGPASHPRTPHLSHTTHYSAPATHPDPPKRGLCPQRVPTRCWLWRG